LEEEVEFGSDEDLIDDIGEIILPQSQAASVSGSGGKQNGKSKDDHVPSPQRRSSPQPLEGGRRTDCE